MAVADPLDLPTRPCPAADAARTPAVLQTPMGRKCSRCSGCGNRGGARRPVPVEQAPDYGVLFPTTRIARRRHHTAELDKTQHQHKFSENGTAILVPTEQVHDAA